MTDKEFKRLRRSDLIDIIYEYQKNEEKMAAEIKELKEKLEAQEMKISKAGSIAEAVVSLNDLFETAQRTADQYIQKLQEANRDTEKQRDEIIAEAHREAARIRRKAEVGSANKKSKKAVNDKL